MGTLITVTFATLTVGELFRQRLDIFREDEDAVADNTIEGNDDVTDLSVADVESMMQVGDFAHTFEATPPMWRHMLALMEIAEEDAEDNARNARPKSSERRSYTAARLQYQEIARTIKAALES